jgi:DNA-binding NtrC family response regulator
MKADLLSYSWPGNIRELRNFCKFIMIHETKLSNVIILKHLKQKALQAQGNIDQDVDKYIKIDNLKDSVAAFERDYLLHHLALISGRVSMTVITIGIERTTLYKKMKALDISTLPEEE